MPDGEERTRVILIDGPEAGRIVYLPRSVRELCVPTVTRWVPVWPGASEEVPACAPDVTRYQIATAMVGQLLPYVEPVAHRVAWCSPERPPLEAVMTCIARADRLEL